jgi:hypothetical protein
MAQFVSIDKNVRVSGAAVMSVVEGMGVFKPIALRILKENGIVDPEKDKWYPQQAWLDAFKRISEQMGQETLRAIGEKIPGSAVWPKHINGIEEALASIDVAYHINHFGGEIGHYSFEKTGERSGKMVCNNPYPCSFDLGIVKATASRFAPEGVIPIVKHDAHGGCRQKGGDSCTFLVSW